MERNSLILLKELELHGSETWYSIVMDGKELWPRQHGRPLYSCIDGITSIEKVKCANQEVDSRITLLIDNQYVSLELEEVQTLQVSHWTTCTEDSEDSLSPKRRRYKVMPSDMGKAILKDANIKYHEVDSDLRYLWKFEPSKATVPTILPERFEISYEELLPFIDVGLVVNLQEEVDDDCIGGSVVDILDLSRDYPVWKVRCIKKEGRIFILGLCNPEAPPWLLTYLGMFGPGAEHLYEAQEDSRYFKLLDEYDLTELNLANYKGEKK